MVRAFDRVDNIFKRCAANDAIAQRLDFLAAFNDRARRNTTQRAAVLFADDDVLGHVNQTPRQVTRVGGFERRIGETFTRAVCRDEVLQHVQAFAEVRMNRRLDNFAGRTRHQSAHTRQLANLLRATTRAGIAHDQDGIQLARRLLAFIHRLEHFLGNFVSHFGPDSDDFVVASHRL